MTISSLPERQVAEAILSAIRTVAEAARALDPRPSGGLVHSAGVQTLARIQSELQDALRVAAREPLIARVDVELGESEDRGAVYICRGAAAGLGRGLPDRLASYRSPVGRIAELEVGEYFEVRLPKGVLEGRVVERAMFRPEEIEREWDARDVDWSFAHATRSIDSLRGWLRTPRSDDGAPTPGALDYLDELLGLASSEDDLHEGRRRQVVDRISLRDQAILDRYQGEVFRLPIDRRLVLLGPPGTGKTTTLIKRIAQKRTVSELDEDERELLEDFGVERLTWRMYSPTELLALYLGEAFNKEGVPTRPYELGTWSRDRRDLARNVFGILKSGSGGRFGQRDDLESLADTSSIGLCSVHDHFASYLDDAVVAACARAIDDGLQLEGKTGKSARPLLMRLRSTELDVDRLHQITANETDVLDRFIGIFDSASKQIERKIFERFRREQMEALIGELAKIVERSDGRRLDDDDEEEEDADLDAARGATGAGALKRKGYQLLWRAIRRQALGLVMNDARKLSPRFREALALMKDNAPRHDELRSLGENQVLARSLRILRGAARRFVADIGRHYSAFRREAVGRGQFYRSPESSPGRPDYLAEGLVSAHEVDVLVLVALRNLRRLRKRVPKQSWYDGIDERVVSQIYVDEVTDFSAVQLACMLELSDRRLRSFFACGDFRQRIGASGIDSEDELKWIAARTDSDAFELREVSRLYRQSARLAQLAHALAQLQGRPLAGSPDDDSAANDPMPLLAEGVRGDTLADWMADRILEVERDVGKLPSIAVFVDGEEKIDALVEAVGARLAEDTIGIVGCPEGRIVGDARDVRVFDLRHIKGLEFEAVFFVGVDALAARLPALFDRYLYVGVTRAATYLAIACEDTLPAELETVRPLFSTGGW